MKVIFDKNECDYIARVNSGIHDGPLFIDNTEDTYYIEFKANDIGKANAFIDNLMKPRDNTSSEMIGIDVTCITFSNPDRKKNNIKSILQKAIDFHLR